MDIEKNDAGVYQVGRCLVHTVVFQDVGLVWCAPPSSPLLLAVTAIPLYTTEISAACAQQVFQPWTMTMQV
jgi:hypothetical protein